MKTPISVTISKNNRDQVTVYLKDRNSNIRFAEVKLTLEDYARVITGLSEVIGEGEVRGLENIGKLYVHQPRTAHCPHENYTHEQYEQWLQDNCREEGWIVNSYLGSQTSISRSQDPEHRGSTLRYFVYKYVGDQEEK